MNLSDNKLPLLNELYKLMKEHQVIMIYEGEFSQDITKAVLSMTENSFTNEQINEPVKKKVYNIMMESLQNICKHEFKTSESENLDTESLFMIASTDTYFHIITGNAIKRAIIETIKSKIDAVNILDAEGLKQLYKKTRLNSTISEVGGAGLGFIDIARKSENKISYHFEMLKDDIYYFTQMVSVNK